MKNREGRSYVKTSNIIKFKKNIKKPHKIFDNIKNDYSHKTITDIVKAKLLRIVMRILKYIYQNLSEKLLCANIWHVKELWY